MDPAIAARVTASSSSTSSRSYATASPTTSRTANSMPFPHTGPISNNNDDAILNSQITLEQALAAHANARDPARAALEAILQERNTLSYQNSQLWNHLKKQRSNYQAAAVDLKRIRAERESLRTKLAEYEQPADGEHSDERRLRSSHSAALLNASTPRDTQSYSNENVSSESPLRARTSSSHHKNSRDHSEDRHGKYLHELRFAVLVLMHICLIIITSLRLRSCTFSIARSPFDQSRSYKRSTERAE